MTSNHFNLTGLTSMKIASVSMAALIAASMAGSAFAQTVDASAETNVDATLEAQTANGDTKVAAASTAIVDSGFKFDGQKGDGSFDLDAILSLETQSNFDGSIDATRVSILDIDDTMSAEAQFDLMTKIEQDSGIIALRAVVAADGNLSAVLDSNGFDANDVVGVELGADGAAMIYVADGVSNLNCDGSASGMTHTWAAVEDVNAAAHANISIANDCIIDDAWTSNEIELAAMANAEISLKLENNGYDINDILGVVLVSDGYVSVVVGNRS